MSTMFMVAGFLLLLAGCPFMAFCCFASAVAVAMNKENE